jgi:chemotaxis protein CheD
MRETGRFPALRPGDVFLNPGELHCGYAPARVWTILGSCVSVILWHRKLKFGAMSHYLLPDRVDVSAPASTALDPRYGTDASKLMLAAMRRAGVKPELCQARVFGGSQMFGDGKPGMNSIGQRNAAIAYEFLERNRIKLTSESLFGGGHRRVHFDLSTGRVWESEANVDSPGSIVRKSAGFP